MEKVSEDNALLEEKKMSESELRENLIETAVKFLQNPKVRQSPFSQRKTFLEKKGLTENEIQAAIERSGTAGDATAVQPMGDAPSAHAQMAPMPPVQQQVSAWAKARDVLASAIVIGGVSYAVYILYKKYLYPVWFGPSKEQEKIDQLSRGMLELQETMSQTLKQIQETQAILSKQQDTLQEMAQNNAVSRGPTELGKLQDSQALTDIKDEIKSLKGLLLSSRRFPAAPTTTPVLPSWQLTPSTAQNTSPDTAQTTVTQSKEGSTSSISETEVNAKALTSEPDKLISSETSPTSLDNSTVSGGQITALEETKLEGEDREEERPTSQKVDDELSQLDFTTESKDNTSETKMADINSVQTEQSSVEATA